MKIFPADQIATAVSCDERGVAAKLEPFVSFDAATGDLVLQNGKARIVLQGDGTVRVEGVRIVGIGSESIALRAAVIDLN